MSVIKLTNKNRINFISLMFFGPALLLYFIFTIIPSTVSLLASFTDWNGLSKNFNFIGIANFVEIFTGERFINAIRNTILITFFSVICVNVLAIILAVLLDNITKGKSLFRSIFFVPQVLSAIIVSYMWAYILNYDSGIFNVFLNKIGAGSLMQDWLGDPRFALISFILILIWQGVGFYMVIYLATLQTIPCELIEASKIDGAGPLRQFMNITLPLLAPAVTTCVILSILGALNVYDMVIALTNGGPGFSTETIVVTMLFEATRTSRQGVASAEAVVLFLATMAISIIVTDYLRKKEVAY